MAYSTSRALCALRFRRYFCASFFKHCIFLAAVAIALKRAPVNSQTLLLSFGILLRGVTSGRPP